MGLCEVVVLGVRIRGLKNLEAPFEKVLILLVRNRGYGELNQGLQNLEAPCKGTDWYFLRRAKSTAKTRRGLRPSGLPGTIQSSAGNTFGEASDGMSRNRFFAQDGGEKALNRCDAPALQRKELERTAKEEPYSLRTVGYGWVRMGGGG